MRDYFTTSQPNHEYTSPPVRLPSPQSLEAFELPEPVNLPKLRFQGILFNAVPQRRQNFYKYTKRSLDISFSIAILVAALPLIAAIVALIKFTSPGPVIFRHKRLGVNGVEFDCFKFRTMVSDAEEQLKKNEDLKRMFQEKFKIEDDPRITRIGRFLRCASLDELPQLIQVLQGKMTLIGPRPIVHEEKEKYSIYADKLLSVKPGLSGLWQTSGRSGTTYRERVFLDMHYIDNRCLMLDLYLLVLTVAAVIRKSGAC